MSNIVINDLIASLELDQQALSSLTGGHGKKYKYKHKRRYVRRMFKRFWKKHGHGSWKKPWRKYWGWYKKQYPHYC